MTAPMLDQFAASRLRAGWEPQAIATACGVSVRTVQRWRADFEDLVTLTCGDHAADFVLRRDKPPLRVSAWRRAA